MSDEVEDPCALVLEGDYDNDLHIGAIFIILGCSLLGCFAPIATTMFKWKFEDATLICGKLFGGGVILATGFIHMMLPAFAAFSNTDCLPKAFSDYEGYAGLIALFTLLTSHLLQTIARGVSMSNKSAAPAEKDVEGTPKKIDHGHDHGAILLQEKRVITYAVEVGVATHSVIIGITLGVTREEFTTLLAALCVHQFFEGVALSTIIREAEFKGKLPIILMLLFYSLTTPVGVAIGVGINDTFNENSQSALISFGVLDSMSAGILIYDALVNIIMIHFNSDVFQKAGIKFQSVQVFFLWLGAAAMAIVGKYA